MKNMTTLLKKAEYQHWLATQRELDRIALQLEPKIAKIMTNYNRVMFNYYFMQQVESDRSERLVRELQSIKDSMTWLSKHKDCFGGQFQKIIDAIDGLI